MIYQHATSDRNRAIAQALGGLVGEVRQTSDEPAGEQSDAPRAWRVIVRVWPCVARAPLRP